MKRTVWSFSGWKWLLPFVYSLFGAGLWGSSPEGFQFELESQPLADALESFSELSGVDVLARSEILEGKTASALMGSFSAKQALQLLLAESGLAFQFVSESTVAISPAKLGMARRPEEKAAEPERSMRLSDTVIELAPFTVVASGSQSVLQVTRADLELRQASDLEDVLSIDPSLSVGGSTGIAQKIYVRNMGEGLLNVTIDGAHQTGSLFHHVGRVAVESEFLKRVEIQPGVGDAADGPGSVGGAIRFVTIDPSDLLDGDSEVAGTLKATYFSNTRGRKATLAVANRLSERWSSLLSYVRSDHDDIEDGDGHRLQGSASRQQGIMAKAIGEFENGQRLRLSFEQLDEEGSKLRRPEWGPGPSNPVFPMRSGRSTAAFGYAIRPDGSDWIDFEFSATRALADLYQDAVWGPYIGSVESYQFDARNTQIFGRHEIAYGVDYREDKVRAGPDTDPSAFEEIGSVLGIYLQDQYRAGENLLLGFGARFDRYELTDSERQAFGHTGVSPNLGFVLDVTPGLSLNGGVSASYRGPDVNDAFRLGFATNDPKLEAEKARNFELGLDYGVEAFDFGVGLYRHRIEGVITNTLPWGEHYANAAELATDGLFARASYVTESVRFSLQYSDAGTAIGGRVATRYQYGSLVSTTGATWVAEAAWRPTAGVNLGWNARVVEGIRDILIPYEVSEVADSRIDKPGYATHDVFVSWTPRGFERMRIDLTIKNVFDKRYLSHGSVEDLTGISGFEAVVGALEPGRDFRLSFSWRF